MIDTISLLIPKEKLKFLDLSQHGVPKWDLQSRNENYEKYIKNPSNIELRSGLCFPRLTGYKRKSFIKDSNIKIEFSVPKLIYLNNLDELSNNDFTKVIETLQKRLNSMGVSATLSTLQNALVSSVHFSKNIVLQDGYTANYLISEMNKVDLRKSFDFAKTRFINDGQSLYAHATTHQFVIYDKIADLNKDKKRAIDKDQTLYQRNLFTELARENQPKEIIRFEVRLSQKQKMNKVLNDLGYQKNPTFKQIFNSNISKSVISTYWKKIIKERNFGVFSISVSTKDMLQELFLSEKNIKPKQAIYYLGLYNLIRDENGMRHLRTIISKRTHDRTWYRISKDIKRIDYVINQNNPRDWVKQVDKQIDEYRPYKHKKPLIS